MDRKLKLIFIHGINAQTVGYSARLYESVAKAVNARLKAAGKTGPELSRLVNRLERVEVVWAQVTAARDNRYLEIAAPKPETFWWPAAKRVDPLAMQIMQYIKDKGDHNTGVMNILGSVADQINTALLDDSEAIIVAHSLGSVIAFDYVMQRRPAHQLPESTVLHDFITMGSPLSMFTSAMGHPDSDMLLPPNAKRWTNIHSYFDGIARPLQPFFHKQTINDHRIHTAFRPVKAHTAYWSAAKVVDVVADSAISALLNMDNQPKI
jgi:hypothetical protein